MEDGVCKLAFFLWVTSSLLHRQEIEPSTDAINVGDNTPVRIHGKKMDAEREEQRAKRETKSDFINESQAKEHVLVFGSWRAVSLQLVRRDPKV